MARQIKFLPNLKNTRVVIILEHEANPMYFRYLWTIVLNAYKQGAAVTIYDCDWDNFEFSNKNHDPNRETDISRMRDEFLKTLSQNTNNTVKVMRIDAGEIIVAKREITQVSDFLQADKIHLQLGNSLRSVFTRNYLSTSNLTLKGFRMRKQFRVYVQTFLTMRLLSQSILLSDSFDLILIANGRFPSQTAMRVVAENAGIEFYFYEHGMPKGESFHFASFQTQEFQKMQEFIQLQITESLETNKSEIIFFANQWLDRQAGDINQNQYLNQGFGETLIKKNRVGKPLAVIFNSSIDEKFSNMGVDLNGWDSQKQATSEIANTLKRQGFEVLVRIHPNTANKSWWDLINLVYYLKANEIEYVLPWNGPSSYSLLKESELVLTWGSTISMESIARGIPTVVFGRTMYDEIAGAVIVSPATLKAIDFNFIAQPDSINGKVASYFNKHWGYSLHDYCSTTDLELIDSIMDSTEFIAIPNVAPTEHRGFINGIKVKVTTFITLARRIRKGRYASPNDYRKLAELVLTPKFSNPAANLALSLGLKFKSLTRDGEVSL